MWPRNDGTFVTPQGQPVPQQLIKQLNSMPSSSDAARVKNGGWSSVTLYRKFHFVYRFIDRFFR